MPLSEPEDLPLLPTEDVTTPAKDDAVLPSFFSPDARELNAKVEAIRAHNREVRERIQRLEHRKAVIHDRLVALLAKLPPELQGPYQHLIDSYHQDRLASEDEPSHQPE